MYINILCAFDAPSPEESAFVNDLMKGFTLRPIILLYNNTTHLCDINFVFSERFKNDLADGPFTVFDDRNPLLVVMFKQKQNTKRFATNWRSKTQNMKRFLRRSWNWKTNRMTATLILPTYLLFVSNKI